LLVGCGDVALRAAEHLRGRARIYGLARRPEQHERLRTHGVVPIGGDLDAAPSLDRLRTAPFAVVHAAPPPSEGSDDPRTVHLLSALGMARILPRRLVYISTSGVYGDCAGARIDESRPRRARSPRAVRRVAAEDRLREWGGRNGVAVTILRAPGIYAEQRLPLDRIREGTPVLRPEDDVYTNHVHADDLARAVVAALFRGRANRAYNVTDDAEMKMGSWFDAVADAHRLPRPPKISWEEAETRIAPMLLSFMSESRRLANRRLKRELRFALRHPTPQRMLDDIHRAGTQLALPI
jgi:nucleoside-diphosphate-sugar epimerase